MFRGMLFASCASTGYGPAALVSSMVLSLTHAGEVVHPGPLVTFVALGRGFDWVYELTGSLNAPVAAHALLNAVSLAGAAAR